MRKFFTKHPILFPMIYGALVGSIASVFFAQSLRWWPPFVGLFAGFVLGLLFEQAMRHQLAEERQYSHFVSTLKPELKSLPDPVTSLFLYNTLHNISALLLFDGDAASATAEKLANLVRSVNELRRMQTTSLGEEFKASGLYLEIERSRLGDRLIVSKEFDQDFFEVPFPSLALYPFVDNCVRYGAEMHMSPVTVMIVCRRLNNDLIIEVADKVQNEDMERDITIEQNRNSAFEISKQRLTSFYGSSVKLHREQSPSSGEHITIKIPLNNAKIGRYSR
jgi:two-component system, LytTR family, sensor histidine kinase AlgZ